jgi:hypothetical protein
LTTNVLTFNLAGSVRHQGLPVSAVVVSLYDCLKSAGTMAAGADNLVSQQTTGARGEFTFAVRPGVYRLEMQPDRTTRFLRYSVPEIKVASNVSSNINLTTGSILTGQVRTIGGITADSGEVLAIGIEPSSYKATALLDENGSYFLILPKGKYHLAFRALSADYMLDQLPTLERKSDGADSEAQAKNVVSAVLGLDDQTVATTLREVGLGDAFISTAVSVMDLVADDEYDLILPDFVSFTGDVKDIFGQAVGSAKITVTPSLSPEDTVLPELSLSATVSTDASGRFAIKLQPGLFDINVRPDESVHLFGLEDKMVPITKDTHYSFQLSEGFRLRGQVNYEDQPLSHCLVRIIGVDKDVELTMKTDRQGQFAAGLPGGNYKLIVSAHPKHGPTVTIDGSEYAGLAPWTKMVVVGGDTHVAARLSPGTALHGRICDEAGQARPGVTVSVFPEAPASPVKQGKASGALGTATTDGEGRYCIFLSPGTYWIAVHTDLANSRTVEVQNDPVNLDIDWHGWCQLRFELLGDDGHPIPRCRVGYAPYGLTENEKTAADGDKVLQLPRGYLLTGEDGVCQINLPSGIYSLRFSPPQEGSYEEKSIRQLSVSTDLTKTIKLPLKSKSQPPAGG